MTPTIHIENAALAYNNQLVFAKLNLQLPAGKWIALLGPSGIGKSSLMRTIAGLISKEESFSGSIYAEPQLCLSKHIAYMAQTDLLLPWLSVLHNACLGEKLRSISRKTYAAKLLQTTELLKQVGLGDAMHAYPHQLSGGMRQRVALVRTLMENKPIVLMDEPFSALDAITKHQLQDLAIEMLKNKTVLFITHDPAEALRLADSIYVMHGHPATISHFATLTSPTPRRLHEPEFIRWQSELYQTLLQAKGVAA